MRNRQRRIAYRLRERDWAPQDRPMMGARRIEYEVAERTQALSVGGIGMVHRLIEWTGLRRGIDEHLHLLKVHLPYHESDHVLNLAYNFLAGGTRLEDLESLRNDEVFLNALGAQRTPDPTTAGDFCRRFEEADIETLMWVINESRLQVWGLQPESFFDEAILDADGTIAPTHGECKAGMDISHKGIWGYHPLVLSLANTAEPLYVVNRSGNRPSHEGAAERFDEAIMLCRRAGFRKVTLRGDTDFSQTEHLDRWHEEGVHFLFGYDALGKVVQEARNLPKSAWRKLTRPAKYEVQTKRRTRPPRIKEQIVEDREYHNLRLVKESVAEFEYCPTACRRLYRMVVVRKHLHVLKGQRLLQKDHRYFFYITNDWTLPAAEVVLKANARCDQENLIEQLKNGVRALHSPLDNLHSNWAYMVMASLAWTLKAWSALILPETGRWKEKYREEKQELLRMDFKRFLRELMLVPAQIVRTGRKVVFRLLAWTRYQHVFLRAVEVLEQPMLC
jgi:hypothetical protein